VQNQKKNTEKKEKYTFQSVVRCRVCASVSAKSCVCRSSGDAMRVLATFAPLAHSPTTPRAPTTPSKSAALSLAPTAHSQRQLHISCNKQSNNNNDSKKKNATKKVEKQTTQHCKRAERRCQIVGQQQQQQQPQQ